MLSAMMRGTRPSVRLAVLALAAGAALAAGCAAQMSSDGRLYFLDLAQGRVLATDPDGRSVSVVVRGQHARPDGIAVDAIAGYLYVSNMGAAAADDGSIERLSLDGSNRTTIVPRGGTFTAKQLTFEASDGKLYWSDREGMRVMRANLDGSGIETIVETGRGEAARRDARNWCVGIAVDAERGEVYWTQKGGSNANQGSIRRAPIAFARGEDAASRTDIEVLFDGLPEPIDLALDRDARMMYWTDRGDPPGGNSVSRAPMDPPAGVDPRSRTDQQIVMRDLKEGIGIALDVAGRRLFVTDLAGNVYRAGLDGSDPRTILRGQGTLSGIAYVGPR
jgi:sugar lactone lactonase YvrE